MKERGRKNGFTIVELLTSIAIIAILMGILVPSLRMARNAARKASQQAQIAAIDQALMSFKSDAGYYPESLDSIDYYGAQKLAEALLGWDLLGFHPDTTWQALGGVLDEGIYDVNDLDLRMGYYLNLATANAFRLNQLFNDLSLMTDPAAAGRTHIICDVFGVRKVTLTGAGRTVVLKAGTPILYYKADTSQNGLDRYRENDNKGLTALGPLTASGNPSARYHKFDDPSAPANYFRDYITDLAVTGTPWPYNSDSYILISAGVDGIYGTEDDITNF